MIRADISRTLLLYIRYQLVQVAKHIFQATTRSDDIKNPMVTLSFNLFFPAASGCRTKTLCLQPLVASDSILATLLCYILLESSIAKMNRRLAFDDMNSLLDILSAMMSIFSVNSFLCDKTPLLIRQCVCLDSFEHRLECWIGESRICFFSLLKWQIG